MTYRRMLYIFAIIKRNHFEVIMCFSHHQRNHLPKKLEHCNISHADDTVLYYAFKSISHIESKLNFELRKVENWLSNNQLALNIPKSKFMLIGVLLD